MFGMRRTRGPRRRLILSPAAYDDMVAHCRRMLPQEAAGMVGGLGDRGKQVYPVANVHPTPEARFLLDGAEQIEALRAMAAAGQELVAIYHSHPTTPPRPSQEDIDAAFFPDVVYLIVSFARPAAALRGYRIDGPQGAVWSVPVWVGL